MKLSVILTLAVVMMFGVTIAEANVLTNAGFETGNLNGWNDWAASGSTVVTSPVHSGTYALSEVLDSGQSNGGKIQNLISQGMSVGDSLYGNAWIKTSSLTSEEAYLKVEFLDDSWGSTGSPLVSAKLSGTNDWTMVSVNGTIPTGTTKANYILMLSSSGTVSGNAYFDDAYADEVPIPEPTSMLLLGSGLLGLFAFNRKK